MADADQQPTGEKTFGNRQTNRSVRQQIDDVIECPICCDTFNDPRVLPCGHTYCLRCIDGLRNTHVFGQMFRCPECRYSVFVTADGIFELPRNFILLKLKQVTWPEMCGVHLDKSLDLFCVECRTAVCSLCSVEQHATHARDSVARLATETRRYLQSAAEWLRQKMKKLSEFDEVLTMENAVTTDQNSEVELIACRLAKAMKSNIEQQQMDIIRELDARQALHISRTRSALQGVERYQAVLLAAKHLIRQMATSDELDVADNGETFLKTFKGASWKQLDMIEDAVSDLDRMLWVLKPADMAARQCYENVISELAREVKGFEGGCLIATNAAEYLARSGKASHSWDETMRNLFHVIGSQRLSPTNFLVAPSSSATALHLIEDWRAALEPASETGLP